MSSPETTSTTENITIGILGGGQLARLTSMAAAKFAVNTIVYCPDKSAPAASVSSKHFCKPYLDFASLEEFASLCDFVTCEFENVPPQTLRFLDDITVLMPNSHVFDTCSNRLKEKNLCNSLSIPTANWLSAQSLNQLEKIIPQLKLPLVAKTATMGYDGKGQFIIQHPNQLQTAWLSLNSDLLIVEEFVGFSKEISVTVAMTQNQQIAVFPPAENVHVNHILHTSSIPADISSKTENLAILYATTLAKKLNLQGLLTVEMFVLPDGEVYVNELAPRPHNSAHWTIDACNYSQFDLLVMTLCSFPIPQIVRNFDAKMTNLIGNQVLQWQHIMRQNDSCHLYLYNKQQIKENRKMGHATQLFPKNSLTKKNT